MLNYIWAGLIIISVLFALWQDGTDIADDRFRNGAALPIQVEGLPADYQDIKEPMPVTVTISPQAYLSFYKPAEVLGIQPDSDEYAELEKKVGEAFQDKPLSATFNNTANADELYIQLPEALPPPLDVVYETVGDEGQVLAELQSVSRDASGTASLDVVLPGVRFVKLKEVSATMFEMAQTAITFAIGLMGVIALWMGLMKIAEDAGLVAVFVKLVRPVLGPLFPQIPKDHPALGLIAVNLAANMLALGNAATPLGIKAMESLQELNKEKDTASNSMVMLLAMNTASVQLLPPVTLIAILGLAATELFLPIFLVTSVSLVVAVTVTILLGRLNTFRKTDPMRPNNPNAEQGGAA